MSLASTISTQISQAPADTGAAPVQPGTDPASNPNMEPPAEGGGVAPESAPNNEVDFSKQFNALTRRERTLVERENQIKTQAQEVQQYNEDLKSLKENPLAFLEKHGYTNKQIADLLIGDGKPNETSKIDEIMGRLDKFETEREKEIREREEAEAKSKQESTINNFKEEMKKSIAEKAENFELINSTSQFDLVYDVIEEHYKQHGNILDVDKAAEHVEKYLESQLEQIASTSKFKSKYAQGQQEPQTAPPAEQPTNGMKTFAETLTNQDAAQTPRSVSPNLLSRDESISSAAALLQKSLDAKKYGKEL